MKNKNLIKTNLYISIVLIIGFVVTAVLSYRANYQMSLENMEHVTSLSAEGIYYQVTTRFAKPVNVAQTMAHDSLLVKHLSSEADYLDSQEYVETTRKYLTAYRDKYDFDSVFLVSKDSGRYYNFAGVDRIMTVDNPENTWYYSLLDRDQDIDLNVDNDEVAGADNQITVFVNCKVRDVDGGVLGIVGVGIRIDHLRELLREYEENYHLETSLVSGGGRIEISTTYSGYENADWFEVHGFQTIREQILNWNDDVTNLELWSSSSFAPQESCYVVTRYIPELSWNLIVVQNTGRLINNMHRQFYQTCVVLILVMAVVLAVITAVIRNFNRQIHQLMEERKNIFQRATEQMYDNIYELNITKNSYVGERTAKYFNSQGAENLPYDQGLERIARTQIKEEYREGYVKTFTPENVIRQYESGCNQLHYDFMISEDGGSYHWMRIDAYIFFSEEDKCIHMFTYRKNIDEEKRHAIQAQTDEMTGLLNKMATERMIERQILENPGKRYALFFLDIDNFKQVNDKFGHRFGDLCIRHFASIIRQNFREGDVIGRIGGDEFVAFAPVPEAGMEWVHQRAQQLVAGLGTVCEDETYSWQMSASIGVALSPENGTDFASLSQSADMALYDTKKRGKNGYTVASDAAAK